MKSPTPPAESPESSARVAAASGSARGVDCAAGAASEPAATEGTLNLASPVGATLLVAYAWFGTAALFGPFSPVAEDVGTLVLSATFVLALSVVHELGHVIAGWLVGLDFRSLTIGPVALVRTERGYRVRPNGRWKRFAGCVERDFSTGRPDRRRLTVSAAGGPAANLVFALALFAVSARGGIAEDFALWSFLFALVNLVPVHVNGQTSDGGLVWRLWRQRAHVEPRRPRH